MRHNRILLPLITLCITALTILPLSGCNRNTEINEITDRIADQYTKEQVLDFFETVALQAEYSSEDMPLLSNNGSEGAVSATVATHPLVKWEQDTIYYTINGGTIRRRRRILPQTTGSYLRCWVVLRMSVLFGVRVSRMSLTRIWKQMFEMKCRLIILLSRLLPMGTIMLTGPAPVGMQDMIRGVRLYRIL